MYLLACKRYKHTLGKDPVVRVWCGGLWKHQNNPACTKSVRVFKGLKPDTVQMEVKVCTLATACCLMWNRKRSAGAGAGCPKARDQTAVTWSWWGGCPGAVRAKGAQRSWADEDRPVSTAALASKGQYFQEHSEQVSDMITWPVSAWWWVDA